MLGNQPLISLMLAVADAPAALAWYKQALGATELWNLGGVVGMEIDGAPIFLGEPQQNGWDTPVKLGVPSARIEVFCDDPDAFIARAVGPVRMVTSTQSGIIRCLGELTGKAASSIRSAISGWLATVLRWAAIHNRGVAAAIS